MRRGFFLSWKASCSKEEDQATLKGHFLVSVKDLKAFFDTGRKVSRTSDTLDLKILGSPGIKKRSEMVRGPHKRRDSAG